MKFAINRRKQDSTWETLVASSRNFFISSSENTTFMADPLGKGGKAKQNKHTVSFTTLEVWHIRLDCFSEQFQATYGSSLSWERRCFFSQLRLYPHWITRTIIQTKKSPKLGMKPVMLPQEDHSSPREWTAPRLILPDFLFQLSADSR